MVTLADSFRVGAFTIYRNVRYAQSERAYDEIFFAVPDAPRIARDASGAPAVDFIWYRDPIGEPGGPRSGGLLTVTVDLAPSRDERAELLLGIEAAISPETHAAIEIRSMPFVEGNVELSVAGETDGGELVTRVAGDGPARLSGAQRATFAVELSADGAALLWQAIERGIDLVHARYDLVFEHRLDDIELRVWCDARTSHKTLSARHAAGAIDPRKVRELLTTERLAGVELTSPRPLDPAHRAELERVGQTVLDAALASALFTSEGQLRPYDSVLETTLNHTFTQSYPVRQHAVLETVLSLGPRDRLGDRVRRLDLDGGFFRVLEVKIYCTVDFEADPIDKIRLRIVYDEIGPSGPVTRTGEFVFQGTGEVHTFRTELAAPDKRSYRYDVEVFYRQPVQPARFSYGPVEGDAIVLDLDGLGVLDVALNLRDVSFDIVDKAVVELEHPADALSHRIILDGEHLSERWRAIIASGRRDWRYRVSWLTTDNRRLEMPWESSTARAIALDAPATLVQKARVTLVAAGDFSGVAQIIADLRLTSGGDPAEGQLTFTQPGETRVWEPHVLDRAAFRYQIQRTLVLADGVRRTLPWSDEDRPVLIVRNELQFNVQIVARLLDLGSAWQLATVALEYVDEPENIHERQTFLLRNRSDEPHWAFRIGAPERRRYRFQLTLIAQGSRVVVPWREAEEEILVLEPVAP